jgi:sterol desaturase/sphingolipid hydroxylase (fatty acid hydroxylase superfamily)
MESMARRFKTDDPLILAVPLFLGGVAAESLWYRRRRRTQGPTRGEYERRDTIASLTMGTASLVTPVLLARVLRPFALRKGRAGIPLAGAALGAVALTTVADRIRARSEARGLANPPVEPGPGTMDAPRLPPPRPLSVAGEWAARASRFGGAASVVLGGLSIAATWHGATSPERLWRKRFVRSRGRGLLAVVLAIFGWDFLYYWNHRMAHERRFLWAVHVVHHSSERYNLSTALRQPVLSELGPELPYGLLCLFGIAPETVLWARAVNLMYQYWIHTEAIGRLGQPEEILNTPSHHRVHHGSNRRYLDRNYGSILITWDRLFGTFEPESEPAVYGLTHNIETFNPIRIATHEYLDILRGVARSTSWRERLSHVVKGPGWAQERAEGLASA